MRESGLRAIFVFVAPPSVDELEKRLRGRGTETEEAVQKRLEGAKAEIARCGAGRVAINFSFLGDYRLPLRVVCSERAETTRS